MNTEMINDRACYPDSPGFKGNTDTGRNAARLVAGKAALQRKQITAAMVRPVTHDEVAEMIRPLGMTDVEFETFKRGVRSRCSELKAQGKIQATSVRRKNDSGHMAVVWRLTATAPVAQTAVTVVSTATRSGWTGTRAVQQELI